MAFLSCKFKNRMFFVSCRYFPDLPKIIQIHRKSFGFFSRSFLKDLPATFEMVDNHRIEQVVRVDDFLKLIEPIKEEQIITTDHTFLLLQEGERNVFKERVIKGFILTKVPVFVGMQRNGLYAVFYKNEKELLKLIMEIQLDKIEMVTFHTSDHLPRI